MRLGIALSLLACVLSAQAARWCRTIAVHNAKPYGRFFWAGSWVKYECKDGYEMEGEAKLRCVRDHGWDPPTAPSCVKRQSGGCSKPDAPANGGVKPYAQQHFEIGDKVWFTCRSGYEIAPGQKADATCLSTGWSYRTPQCVDTRPVTCGVPEAPENGSLKPIQKSYAPTTKVWYSCNHGYTLNADDKKDIICKHDGEWSHGAPRCERDSVNCGAPEALENGSLKPVQKSYAPGTKVWYSCSHGYTLNADDKKDIVCQDNGQWSHGAPRCEADAKPCRRPSRIRSGSFRPYTSSYKNGATVKYTCRRGYRIVGEATALCQDDGTWDAIPSCEAITCSTPDLPEGADFRPKKTEPAEYRPYSRIYYTCVEGYTRTGPSYARCINGKWSSQAECTAQECTALTAPADGSLTPVQDAYDVNAEVTFSCDDGFMLVGAEVLTCKRPGKWSHTVPTCQPNTCGPLVDPVNGDLTPDQVSYRVGQTITFSCADGYEMMGAEEVECQNGGDWSDVEPTCEAVTCSSLIAPENGEQSTDKPRYRIGETVDFRCNLGYIIVGSQQLECLDTGDWSDVEPTCEAIRCAALTTPDSGSIDIIQDEYNVEQVVTFTCLPTHTLIGASQLTCLVTGDWSDIEPICEEITCDPLVAPENGEISPIKVHYNVLETIDFSCDFGYDLIGAANAQCQPDGLWSDVEPFCQLIQCGELQAPANGDLDIQKTLYDVNDDVTFTCTEGYELMGEETLTCLVSGQWSSIEPKCVAVMCQPLQPDVNGSLEPDQNGYGVDDFITFSCNPGFELIGSEQVTCQSDATWTDVPPACIEITCDPLVAPENGEISPIKVHYNVFETIDFSCNPGYNLIGAVNAQCQLDGLWSDVEPFCQLITCDALIPPFNGEFSLEKDFYDIDDAIDVTCSEGYTLVGAPQLVCQIDGTWSDQVPECEANTCAPLIAPIDGSLSPDQDEYAVDDVITFECDAGFELDGVNDARCQDDGTWTSDEPQCIPVQCGELQAPTNGDLDIQKTFYDVDDDVTFTCAEGYELMGEETLTCLVSGLWSSIEPKCVAVMCQPLQPDVNGSLEPDQNGYGVDDFITFSCNPGFELIGSEQVTCQSDATWTDVPPACVEITCFALVAPENGDLDPVQDTYPVEFEVTFTCADGYNLIGSAVLTCGLDGNWDDVEPTCEAIQCFAPLEPENGEIQPQPVKDLYNRDEQVFFQCNRGYRVNGAVAITCLQTGDWSDIEPTCEEILCVEPITPENGEADPVLPQYPIDTEVSFTCDEGFRRNGADVITCMEDGTWSDVEPTCEAITCQPLFPPFDGSLSPIQNSYPSGSTVTFTCNPGFNLNGATIVNCLDTGLWDDVEPICEAVQCGSLTAPANGDLSPDLVSYPVGFSVTFTCNDGYFFNGAEELICQDDGTWSDIEPTCEAEMCGSLQAPAFGSLTPDKDMYPIGGAIEFSCNDGYRLIGSGTVNCLPGAIWSDVEPTCEEITCRDLIAPDQGSFSPVQDIYSYRAEIIFVCDDGYVLVGAQVLRCQRNGQWSDEEPTCREIRCGALEAPDRGSFEPEQPDYAISTEVTFSCDENLVLKGQEVITCGPDGRWSHPEPICQGVKCLKPRAPRYGYTKPGQSSFGVGETIQFGCRPGYTVNGETEAICLYSGQWSDPVPTCERNQCEKPERDDDGIRFFAPYRNSYTYRSRLYFWCKTGYVVVGNARLLCQADGTWDNEFPTCEKVECRAIVAPENGFFDVPKPNYFANDRVTFGCDEGYQINGAIRIVCLRNGKWSAPEPTCEPATCPIPRTPRHGSFSPQQTTPYVVGDLITYQCENDYVIKGEANHECLPSGRWSHRAPYCVLPKCPQLNAPANGIIHPEQTGDSAVGQKLWFSCNLGYQMIGEADIECEYPGSWSSGVPECVLNSCAGRCGPFDRNSGCQCDYQCGSRGNCCHDYIALCAQH